MPIHSGERVKKLYRMHRWERQLSGRNEKREGAIGKRGDRDLWSVHDAV